MKTRLKGWSLFVLALLVISVSLIPDLSRDRHISAQTSPFDTPTLTASITPTKAKRVINELRFPNPGDAVAGVTAIIGTALTNQFNRYDIHVSPSGMENWQWLTTNIQ